MSCYVSKKKQDAFENTFGHYQQESAIFIERGEQDDTLIIAFSGIGKGMMMHPFEFFQMSKTLKYSRILLRDPYVAAFLKGLEGEGIDALMDRLRHEIEILSPKKIIILGVSLGGYAALFAGHYLKADYVHAFAPYTYLGVDSFIKKLDWGLIAHFASFSKIYQLPKTTRQRFDLKNVLCTYNGHTHYYLHVCQHFNQDTVRAMNLADCDGVKVLGYDCKNHFVARFLARKRWLHHILLIENQEDLLSHIPESTVLNKPN